MLSFTFGHISDLFVILHLFDDGLHLLEAFVFERPDDALRIFFIVAEDEGFGTLFACFDLGLGIGRGTRFNLWNGGWGKILILQSSMTFDL